MSEDGVPESDPYLDKLRSARQVPAVLKLRLAQLRSSAPGVAVFAFEGDDDKLVYAQWIRRVRPTLQYEPFPCDGKRGVLTLRTLLLRDKGGLATGVYYFIDRDYDDLAGHHLDECIFMTDMYSVENYLVSEGVLTELLKNEFHCHLRPDVRDSICQLFRDVYQEFLSQTKELNRRIFVARRLGLELKSSLPKKIVEIAKVELAQVAPADVPPEDAILYSAEPSEEDLTRLREEFEGLDPASRYRGKYALLFFQRWLIELGSEYRAPALGLFKLLDVKSRVRSAELVLSNFASKSDLPAGLQDFIQAIPAH